MDEKKQWETKGLQLISLINNKTTDTGQRQHIPNPLSYTAITKEKSPKQLAIIKNNPRTNPLNPLAGTLMPQSTWSSVAALTGVLIHEVTYVW